MFDKIFTACPKCNHIIDVGTKLKHHKCQKNFRKYTCGICQIWFGSKEKQVFRVHMNEHHPSEDYFGKPKTYKEPLMNFFKMLAFKFGKNYLLQQLHKVEFKRKIVDTVNDKVDIPKLTEKQEVELFNAVYDALIAYVVAK